MIAQTIIAVTGMASIALLSQKGRQARFVGCLVGLLGEPAWLYAALTAAPLQWGVAALAVWWTGFFAWGMWNNRRLA